MAPGQGGAHRKPRGGGYGETDGRGEGGNHAPSKSGSSYTQGGGTPPEAAYTREHLMLMADVPAGTDAGYTREHLTLMTDVPAVAEAATTRPTTTDNMREEGKGGGEGEIG